MPLTSILPTPIQTYTKVDNSPVYEEKAIVCFEFGPPAYGHRQNFVPRRLEDFGDGGSFPEISVAQYPLEIGKTKRESRSKILPITVDAQGKIKYDAIVKQGHHADKIIKSKYEDLLPKTLDEEDEKYQIPNEETIAEVTEKTRLALEKLVSSKIAAAMPVKAAEKRGPAQFIRYTPSQQNPNFNSGAKQRIIRMVEMPKDPMSPPRFKINKKIPRGESSPPVPVLHSPPRKLSVKEQQDWKIPPCISNWKNPKGYTIPLDKRLAADGRGLQEVTINENFAKLAESLYIADRKAREAVEMRAQMERKLAQREKEKKEEHLRLLAQKAREARAGIKQTIAEHLGTGHPKGPPGMPLAEGDTEYFEREQIRKERHLERQRDRNLARAAPDRKAKLERERDISEKIALGLPNPNFNKAGGLEDTHFDQRLFNQSQGLDSGFTHDEAYNVYDKPWRDTSTIGQSIYRPSKNIDTETYGEDLEALIQTNRFVPDKQFSGLDKEDSSAAAAPKQRTGPIQFEKERTSSMGTTEDPFNLDKFLGSVKKAAAPIDSSTKHGSAVDIPSGSKHSSKTETSSNKKRGRDDDQPTFGRHGADKNPSKKR